MDYLFKSDWLSIEAKANKTAEININGIIGGGWFDEGEGNTAEKMRDELKAIEKIDAEYITVYIDSLGGSVSHALSIYGLLSNHKAEVTTIVEGMSASAATVIAQAGDIRKVSDNALYLIHNVRALTMGSLNQVQNDVKNMEKVNDKLVEIYTKRSGKDAEEIRSVMSEANGDGYWMDADEVMELGLADEIHKSIKMAAKVDVAIFNKAGLPIPNSMSENAEKSMIEKILNKVGIISDKVEAIGTKDDSEEIENLKAEVVNSEQKVLGLESQVADLESELEASKGDVKSRDSEIETLKAEIADLQSKLNIQTANPVDPAKKKVELGSKVESEETKLVKELLSEATPYEKDRSGKN